MDSWTLQGDSYSFLRSAPRTVSLCHRDGTPNHVEIFDIINVPTQRSAISETTCLCDIFGDDCESPSLSSSPSVRPFVPSQREVDETAAATPLLDDLNDSSGSYHTAPGSIEGEEGFEDSKERLQSPLLQDSSSEWWQSEVEREISEDTSPYLEQQSKSPAPPPDSLPSEDLNTGERTSSLGQNRSISPEEGVSPLSSSSFEKRQSSSSSPNPHSEAEPERIVPVWKDKHNSPSHQLLAPSPHSELTPCVSSSSSESVNTLSSSDFVREEQKSPKPESSHSHQHSSPSPEPTPKDVSISFTESAVEFGARISIPLPVEKSLSHSRESLVFPELKNTPYSPNTQASPFPELRGRVSLPDLFSQGSTPDVEEPPSSPGLISNPSTGGRDTTTTPDNQNTSFSIETGSADSTPAPRYTPPSPVISLASPQELVEGSISPELRHTARSPGLLGAAPLVKTGIRTPSPCPSPKIRSCSTTSENRSQVSSPAVSYSLSPSPGSNCSHFEHRHTASSPEIRITASSPEPYSDSASASSRSLTSSPRITGISYTVVQPEDRDTPPFLELSHPSTPEPDRTLGSSEARSPTQTRDSKHSNIAESTGTPRDSPNISRFTNSDLQPEITSHQARYQTPSPQIRFHTPSPEPRHQTPTSLSASPSHLTPSRDLSPASPSPEQTLLATVFTGLCPQHTQCTPPLSVSPETERVSSSADFPEIEYSAHLEKEASPSSESDTGNNSFPAEIKSISPVAAVWSPVFDLPFLAEEKVASSHKQQSTESEAPHTEVNIQDKSKLVSFSEEKQESGCTFFQKAESYYNLPVEIRSPSPNFQVFSDRGLISSPVHRAKSDSSVQRAEKQQLQLTTYSPTSESSSSLKSACTPEQSERHLTTKVNRENRERITDNMSHYTSRRRTPSPPLTRFTPVHIIAPEKPYRQWQNRSRSPSQVVASSPSGNLKTAVTNRESPHAAPVDNNSQGHCGRQGGRLEMDREMQLERERGVVKQRQRNREMETERRREERVPEKGEGWQGNASYRGEQVELSFNARNRKGPASRSAAPTSRETRQGLPAVHSYSESLLATRQLQQQQGLQRLASQQDTRGGGPSRRLQPPTHQNRNSALGRVAASRPCRSSSSSMGSELDEADNEVKWFTDLAFRSLSSPEVDYLDMYNSSHRSSTNISQPSTQESPAGVNPAWQAYADFRGSAPKLDNDELSFQQSSAYYSDGLDPSRRYEMGSFECVDVAVEREDSRKVRRGVPKRQIQLKRKNNTEGKQDESSENSSPGIPVMMESPSLESRNRETFLRQHSTPAATQDCYSAECSPGSNQKNERKFKLQKSASLDETCTKTKIATCFIQSVLSKKMQNVDKPDEPVEAMSPAFEEISPPSESAEIPLEVPSKPGRQNLSPTLKSDHDISPEKLVSGDPSAKDKSAFCKSAKSTGLRSSYRPSSSSSSRSVSFSQTDSEEADSQNATSRRLEMRSELKVPFENSKQSRSGVRQADDIKSWDEKECGGSANAIAGNFGAPSATGDSSMRERMTNSDQECENTEDHKQLLQGDRVAYTSKPQEITLKAVEKKKASLNVCLTPEAENKLQPSSPDLSVSERKERVETSVDERTGEDEEHCNSKVKTPIHKVRDVRQLVKNTYNLSFKAPSPVIPSDVKIDLNERTEEVKEEREEEVMAEKEKDMSQEIWMQERREEREGHRVEKEEEQKAEVKDSNLLNLSTPPQSTRKPLSRQQPMQIEYKAVCWKENKNKTSCSKKENTDKPQASPDLVTEVSRELHKSTNTQNYTTGVTAIDKPCQQDLKKAAETHETVTEKHKMPDKDVEPVVVTTDRKPPMLGSLPKLPSKEREVSTAVVLIRDGSSKTMTSASPAPEEIPTPVQFPTASLSPGLTTPGSPAGHSVSMLLKEKGYQADIGAVVGDSQNAAGGKGPPRKHVNCLQIPLQTAMAPDGGRVESHRERTLSSSSTMSGPSVLENTDMLTKSTEAEEVNIKPPVEDVAKQKSAPALRNTSEQTPPLKQKEHGDFEAVKRLDPTFPPRSPAIRRFRPQPIAVKSLSKETHRQEMPAIASGNNRPQTIEVKSIAKNSQKPVVPPKPTCKFKPADLGAMPNEAQRPSATTSSVKPQCEERQQTIVVSSPTIYRKISNESSSNYTRKLAVSAVSSLKPPPSKTTATTISSLSNQSAPSEAEAYSDRGQQPTDSPQTSTYTQRPTTLGLTSTTCPSSTLAPGPVSDTAVSQVNPPTATGANQPIQPDVMDSDSQPLHHRMGHPHEPSMPLTLNNTQQPAAVSKTQVPGYTHQPYRRSLSNEHPQRTDGLRFYASDDPPSYDERESFSPVMLPDLTPRRSSRYQPSSHPPPCSCTASCPSHPGLTPHHHHRSPHSLTPPAPPHSPGQALPYTVAQPSVRPHLCRPDTQPISYQPSSPKSSPLGPSQPPALYQPLHHPPPCPPHPSLMQACTADRPLQPPQQTDPRRPPVHRSPQQQPPTLTGAQYNDPGHSHPPGLPPMDPQYLCGPQSMGPSYGSEYGGDSSSLYSESNYGQTPRRVLLDPETGKYFYIEVPVQPLRKMLFDPETGQYVEVLIPQQAMSHSGLYPPSAAPYSSLHNTNMYAPAPQYLPYAAPPPPAHAQPQPPRYPEASAEATMHPSGPGARYRNHSGQASKPEPPNHRPLDQSYLESMYYVPTGMNASPNPTPPDYYHKHPPNLPPTGGKRS